MFEENDLLKILINYNFSNLYRGEKNVSSFLEEHFNQYICDIKWGLKGNNKHIAQFILNDISKDFDKLVSLEKNIIDIIKTFEDGHLKKAYDEAFKFFDNNKDLFWLKHLMIKLDIILHVFDMENLSQMIKKNCFIFQEIKVD